MQEDKIIIKKTVPPANLLAVCQPTVYQQVYGGTVLLCFPKESQVAHKK